MRNTRLQINCDTYMKPWQAWLIRTLLLRFTKHVGPVTTGRGTPIFHPHRRDEPCNKACEGWK